MITITSSYAESHFQEVIKKLEQEPVVLTSQGQTVAYLLSPKELKNLLAEQAQRDNALLNYQQYQERVAKQVHPDADLLSDEDINQLVHELR